MKQNKTIKYTFRIIKYTFYSGSGSGNIQFNHLSKISQFYLLFNELVNQDLYK